ncbi:membrane carboxypeptidase/Penicillin-binding protein [Leptospira ryugenii]|uniref:peptidoglycan glycosyltransferase n=1 Tax=Leptospira ryugenii TaxID=1917863 RepID=A0A2P2DYX3_9LEPT|nr:PBP1A family penicillin-binding protein [Leptospira ryugenii]GBF49820.1 membrane carboxypeptidase/Penicillin-binding protein [Leptospira ryugenii]
MNQEKTLKITLSIFFVISLLGGLFFGYILSEVNQGKELQKLASYQPTTPTKLYDANGVLFAELYRHKQELLKYQDIPPHVIHAFLSVEDDNFFNHFGIDFLAIVRAAIKNVLAGRIVQGGSTLTQQLAKTILQERKKTFARKFLEALLTLQIEQEYTKEEILEIYFNLIYLGHGTTGLSSAANVYFQKDVRDLDVAEAALLARLPKAPVTYSPFKNPMEAKNAHKIVLGLMAKNGFIPEENVQKIHEEFWQKYWPIVVTQSPSRSTWGTKLNRAPHFTEYVRQILEKQVGEDAVYTGGLKVYTTLDVRKQEIAEEELRKSLIEQDRYAFGANFRYAGRADRSLVSLYNLLGSVFPVGVPFITNLDDRQVFRLQLEKEMAPALELLTDFVPSENESAAVKEFRRSSLVFSSNLHVEGAIITIDHQTGYIQTMVGGSRFTPKNQFNRAMSARRQTGSAFKPMVYAAAIQNRAVGSGTGIMDAPLTTLTEEGEGYSPQDISGDFRGMVPLSRALSLSLNIVSVQVLMRTGTDSVIDFASKVTKANKARFPTGPALALGVAELTPYEMAVAYSIMANRGRDVIPFGIRYVLDQSGSILYNREKEVQEELAEKAKNGTIQIIPEATAYIIRQMLIGVATGGTPTAALRDRDKGNYKGISGGKTGSTSSYTNVWYCGFDPKFTTVVWMGFDKSSLSLGQGVTAAGVAAPIFGKLYSRWYNGGPYPEFPQEEVPSDVVKGATCAFNGMTPSPTCPLTSNLFLKPITIAGRSLSVPGGRQCDGDRDHFRSLDLKDFLQRELEISDDELK